MATKKKPSKTSTKSRGRKPAKKSDIDPRWSILLFGLGFLFVALSFVAGESGWAWLRINVLFSGFGICGWLIGPLLIYCAVLIGLSKPVFSAIIKSSLFLLALSGAALVFSKTELAGLGFAETSAALIEIGKTRFGGGLLSIVFGAPLLLLAGRPAANILVVLLVIIAAMVLTGVTPGDIVRFCARLASRIPKREYAEEYYEDDYYDEEPAKTVAQPPLRPLKKRQRNAVAVDINLGPVDPLSAPGLGENDDVNVGPGGTFGLDPLNMPAKKTTTAANEQILPFDPFSNQSLFDGEQASNQTLLFGEDDPYAKLGGAQSRLPRGNLFDVEYIQPPTPAPQLDLFGNAQSVAGSTPNNPFASTPASDLFASSEADSKTVPFPASTSSAATASENMPSASIATAQIMASIAQTPENAAVDAMIDKAAAIKEDKPGNLSASRQELGLYPSYNFPPVSLFSAAPPDNHEGVREEMKRTAELLVSTLESFGVKTSILDVSRGPSVTRYEIQPQAGVKISRITSLADDIALNLAAAGVRIEAPIPGKPAVGIEVPNRIKSVVSIRSILESSSFTNSESPLSIALGKDIAGESIVADLTKMPHLLVAGSTGSGKSVCINATILSFLFRASPEDVRLLLIDPKVVELAEYNGIPHLLMPVVTDPRKAASALGAAVAEMERRYHLFAEHNVRDIRTFNKFALKSGEAEKLPYIAIVIDELADLMMTAGKEVEDYICRIAQKARAAGMHLIVATQRPSVDVITGLIKANIPSRIAFAVSSQIDSRTILDGAGAEKLLGMGDMLFMPVGANKPVRVQGTYAKDNEISAVLRHIKKTSPAQYNEDMIEEMERRAASDGGGASNGNTDDDIVKDPTFISAVETALELGQISTSFLQRRLRLGYSRAGRIMDEMERLHIVSPPQGSKPRDVLINRQQWLEMSMNHTPDASE